MSMGLKVVSTDLMASRETNLGGVYLHTLFGLNTRSRGTQFCLTKLALNKLHRKSQIHYLHTLLTMNVFIIEKIGQFSAQQLTILDLILQNARNPIIPFGGVLHFETMDHTQFGAIDGLPNQMSS